MTGHTSAAGGVAASQCRSVSIRERCGRCGQCVNRSSACRRMARGCGVCATAKTIRIGRHNLEIIERSELVASAALPGFRPSRRLTLLGGGAAWPPRGACTAAGDRVRRIAVLLRIAQDILLQLLITFLVAGQ